MNKNTYRTRGSIQTDGLEITTFEDFRNWYDRSCFELMDRFPEYADSKIELEFSTDYEESYVDICVTFLSKATDKEIEEELEIHNKLQKARYEAGKSNYLRLKKIYEKV